MNTGHRWLSQEEAAAAAALDVATVRLYAELNLIVPSPLGYGEAELAELRRIRRLVTDLGLDHAAIEIVLRMRRQVLALQDEARRLEAALRARSHLSSPQGWIDAEWIELE
jgi:DNA-binding transcriptional MerR regulator